MNLIEFLFLVRIPSFFSCINFHFWFIFNDESRFRRLPLDVPAIVKIKSISSLLLKIGSINIYFSFFLIYLPKGTLKARYFLAICGIRNLTHQNGILSQFCFSLEPFWNLVNNTIRIYVTHYFPHTRNYFLIFYFFWISKPILVHLIVPVID